MFTMESAAKQSAIWPTGRAISALLLANQELGHLLRRR
jgi:hypothetical protein